MGAAPPAPETKPNNDAVKKRPRKFCNNIEIDKYQLNYVISINITDVSDGVYKGYSYENSLMKIGYFIQSADKFYLLKGLILDNKKKHIITIIENYKTIRILHNALLIESITYTGSRGYYVDIKYGDDYTISALLGDIVLVSYKPNRIRINERNCDIDISLLKKKPIFNKFIRLPIETSYMMQGFIPMISDAEYYSLFDLANEILRKDKNPHNLSPCVICSDNKPVWCFDCGHIIYCQKCYTDNMQKIKMICPLCMGLSENIKKVYY
jgi:hypothetical protein